MIVKASALHLLIVVTPTPVDPSACAANDLRCTGRANAEAARLAESSEQRVNYLYRAHRAYLALANKGSKPQRTQDLCRAHELIQQARKLPATSINARVIDSDQQTKDRLKADGIECRIGKRTRQAGPPAVAPAAGTSEAPSSKSPAHDAEPPPFLVAERETASTESATVNTSPEALLPVVARTNPTLTRPLVQRQPERPNQDRLPGRRMVIAGSVTLGAGLALTATAGYLGGRLLGTWRDGQDLQDAVGRYGTPDEATRDAELRHEYQRLRGPTVAMAVVGGSTLIVGAVLVGIGAKRLARVASRTALLPVPGGLVFRARF